MKKFFLISALLLCVSCKPSEDTVEVNINNLTGGMGLESNIFNSQADEQLGTIIFYRSKRIINRLAYRFNYTGDTDVIIQVQGRLAEEILQNIQYFSKGTIIGDGVDVVYLFGEIAEDIYGDIRDQFTIDDIDYLDGKEIVVMGGTEALTVLDIAKQKLREYSQHPPKKLKRIYVTSYTHARDWTQELLKTFYDDLSMLFVTNPLKVSPIDFTQKLIKIPVDLIPFPVEGVRQVSIVGGKVWVFSFDSVSRAIAFLSGAERIPESVLLKKSVRLVGETGYVISYTVADLLNGEVLIHPWLTFNVASDALKGATHVVDFVRGGTTDMVVGYISDNAELMGEWLNILNINAVSDFFVFIGGTISGSIKVPSLMTRAVIRFTGNGLSALVGLLSFNKSFEGKIYEFGVVWDDLKDDINETWKEFLELIGIR